MYQISYEMRRRRINGKERDGEEQETKMQKLPCKGLYKKAV